MPAKKTHENAEEPSLGEAQKESLCYSLKFGCDMLPEETMKTLERLGLVERHEIPASHQEPRFAGPWRLTGRGLAVAFVLIQSDPTIGDPNAKGISRASTGDHNAS